jgi:hypothetical protein
MSDRVDPKSDGARIASRAASATTLVLALLLAAATAAAIVLAVLYFGRPGGDAAPKAGADPRPQEATVAGAEPFVQQGTVKLEGLASGIVYYPTPYTSPPHLTLSPGGRYLIAKQDEAGFTWIDRQHLNAVPELAKDIRGLLDAGAAKDKAQGEPEPQPAQLSWEAKGVRAAAGTPSWRVFEQSGVFDSIIGQQGEVYFVFPYAIPPNVELPSATGRHTVIAECKGTGFKWKNVATKQEDPFGGTPNYGKVPWIAKGIKATELPKGKME